MKKLFLVLALLSFVALLVLPACSKSPGDKIIGHVEAITDIAKDNKDDCDKMGDEMEKYFEDNEKDIEEAVEALEKATDDEKKAFIEDLADPIEKLSEEVGECGSKNDKVGAVAMIFVFMALAVAGDAE